MKVSAQKLNVTILTSEALKRTRRPIHVPCGLNEGLYKMSITKFIPLPRHPLLDEETAPSPVQSNPQRRSELTITLILKFVNSKTVRNTFLFLRNYSPQYNGRMFFPFLVAFWQSSAFLSSCHLPSLNHCVSAFGSS